MTHAARGLSRRHLAPIVILVLLLGQALFLYVTRRSDSQPLPATTVLGEEAALIASLSGAVTIGTASGSRPAVAGDRLEAGSRVQTAADARAEIELKEVGVLMLDAGSLLERTPEPGGRTGFFLHTGKMLVQTSAVDAADLPRLHTPHATFEPEAGRENEFLVLAEP